MRVRYVLLVLAVVGLLWLCSGGPFIKWIRGYHQVEHDGQDSHLNYQIRIVGAGRADYKPWRISRSTEHSPYRLFIEGYFQHDTLYRHLRISSAVMRYPDGSAVELIKGGAKTFRLKETGQTQLTPDGLREIRRVVVSERMVERLPLAFSEHPFVSIEIRAFLQDADGRETPVVLHRRFEQHEEFMVAPLILVRGP
jgi:hypothetical protein